jgi:choice-of-anchor B domain-containing protein
MKRIVFILLITISFVACGDEETPQTTTNVVIPPADSNGRVPCENGTAGAYACNGYDLMSQMDLSDMNGSEGNDIWGWTDPATSREYALMGMDSGTAFVEVTDPENPLFLGRLTTNSVNSVWRDVKTYGNYAFIVSEAASHGMQVFDLTKLRDVNAGNAPVNFSADAIYSGFGNAHNIVINEGSPYAYAVGTSTFSGGAHIVNISDPLNPTASGGYASGGYSHDAQVVTYNGPDTDHIGKEIYIGSNENEVVIVDVTDKFNPNQISSVNYSNIGYTHQGWLTDDQRYFIVGDETDELNMGFDTRTIVFDFIDLDNPSVRRNYTGPTSAIDHNGYVKGNEFFLANYTAGLRVINISSITNMAEVGFFDTYPSSDAASFNGAWSVYPFFPSGNIIVSDINKGLFVIRKSQ